MRIYLVGFMGSGKSSLGQRVAANLEVPFFDTDSVIEAQAGMTIPEIFETFGELYFRQVESDILRQTTFYTKSLNATGGGLPCFEDNMAWMNVHGVTIYLQWPDHILREHLVAINNQPSPSSSKVMKRVISNSSKKPADTSGNSLLAPCPLPLAFS